MSKLLEYESWLTREVGRLLEIGDNENACKLAELALSHEMKDWRVQLALTAMVGTPVENIR